MSSPLNPCKRKQFSLAYKYRSKSSMVAQPLDISYLTCGAGLFKTKETGLIHAITSHNLYIHTCSQLYSTTDE